MTGGAATLLRACLGIAGGLAAGWLVFRGAMFDASEPAFHCVSIGGLFAGTLALARAQAVAHALALVPAFSLFGFAGAGFDDWRPAIAGLLVGLGSCLVAWIFDRLARLGLRFGKFLLTAPLLGGVLFAVAPLGPALVPADPVRSLLFQMFLGVLVGNGVGLGVELAELFDVEEPVRRDVPPATEEPRAEPLGRSPTD